MFKDLTLQFLYHSQSFAGGWNHQYRVRPKCTLRWQCCHILAFCAKERCAPFDYWTKRCDFCLYQYLSLWGIFRFCFWAVFLFSISQAFLSYLDKWRVLNDWFSFFYFLQLGGSHISVVGVCTWIWSGALWLDFWCVAFVAETSLPVFTVFWVSTESGALVRKAEGACFPPLENVLCLLQH